jgi:hypothetical protein
MPKGPSGQKRKADVIGNAVLVMKIATGQEPETTAPPQSAAAELGSKGGKARVEKHNQTMRQHMKRFARLTAGHSKKIDNHVHMVALYTCWYNFARTAAFACRPPWLPVLQTGSGIFATS